MYFIDLVYVVKSIGKSINKKFKNPCKLLTYRGSHFERVVPLAPPDSLSIFTDFNMGHKISVHNTGIFRSIFYRRNKNK